MLSCAHTQESQVTFSCAMSPTAPQTFRMKMHSSTPYHAVALCSTCLMGGSGRQRVPVDAMCDNLVRGLINFLRVVGTFTFLGSQLRDGHQEPR